MKLSRRALMGALVALPFIRKAQPLATAEPGLVVVDYTDLPDKIFLRSNYWHVSPRYDALMVSFKKIPVGSERLT